MEKLPITSEVSNETETRDFAKPRLADARIIKFRGKTIPFKEGKYTYKGEWVYGYFHKTYKGECYIIRFSETGLMLPGVKVDPESVSQFTSKSDKNGKEIYENDIMPIGKDFEIVKWSETEACYFLGTLILSASASHRQVIGNVFENSMLLES